MPRKAAEKAVQVRNPRLLMEALNKRVPDIVKQTGLSPWTINRALKGSFSKTTREKLAACLKTTPDSFGPVTLNDRWESRKNKPKETSLVSAVFDNEPAAPAKIQEKKRRGRPIGSKNKASLSAKNGSAPAKFLFDIEGIIESEVQARLRAARAAAVQALEVALGV